MIKIKIKFFGILSDYFKDLEINVQKNSTIASVKIELIQKHLDFTSQYLSHTIDKSIFSNNNQFLNDYDIIKENCTIFLLPPFSGGYFH